MDPALKHRLIGAAVLSALAIIFLPMLIVGRDKNSGAADVPLTMPAAPDGDFQTKELPLVAPAPASAVPNGGVVGMDASHPPTSSPASNAASTAAGPNGSPPPAGLKSGAAQAMGANASPAASPANPNAVAASNPAASPAVTPPVPVKAPQPSTVPLPPAAVGSPNPTAPNGPGPNVVSAPIPAASAGGHYVVSLGTYSSTANAQSLVASLKGAQLPAYAESVTVAGKQAMRVRIGPFGQRGDAEAARLKAQQLRKDVASASVTALDAAAPAPDVPVASANKPNPATTKPAAATAAPKPIVPPASAAASSKTTPPANSADAPASTAKVVEPSPAAAGRGYAVQVSAYRTEDQALTLRNKLRAAGFTAFSERIEAESGTMYRVRIGPEADRDAADKLRAELSTKMSLNGMVVAYP